MLESLRFFVGKVFTLRACALYSCLLDLPTKGRQAWNAAKRDRRECAFFDLLRT
jgi:hypothetical protein